MSMADGALTIQEDQSVPSTMPAKDSLLDATSTEQATADVQTRGAISNPASGEQSNSPQTGTEMGSRPVSRELMTFATFAEEEILVATSEEQSTSIITEPSGNNSTNGRFGLLALPAELRNRVYEMVLADQPPFWIYRRDGMKDATQPRLTQVCRQIRHESLSIHYALSQFCFPYRSHAQISDKELGPWKSQLRRIEFVTIGPCKHGNSYRFSLLGDGAYRLETIFANRDLGDDPNHCSVYSERLAKAKRLLDAKAADRSFDGRLSAEILAYLVPIVRFDDWN